jgi:hypothetical protein
VPSGSDVTESFDTPERIIAMATRNSITVFKQITIIIEFRFIWFRHLKRFELRTFFLFKFSFYFNFVIGGLSNPPPLLLLPSGHVGAL